jgi:hypothetical protein
MNSWLSLQIEKRVVPRSNPWKWLRQWCAAVFGGGRRPSPAEIQARRVLFLDDDPGRAAVFLAQNPMATWVETVPECLAQLRAAWEEVHLDHDLGGKTFVDMNSDDCGMQVIRWLCLEQRVHLRETRFVVHTHNVSAGLLMVLQMRERGYKAEFLPFGCNLAQAVFPDEPQQDGSVPASSAATPLGLAWEWFGRIGTYLRGRR